MPTSGNFGYDGNNGGGEPDWDLYGPNDTAKPEPTQHALERQRVIWPSQDYLFAPSFKVPDRLKGAPPGHYVVEANEVISADTAESLERQAERLLERAREVRRKYDRFGEDDFPDGAIIVFDKVFHEYNGRQLHKPSKPYHYAAIKMNGLWSTTGPRSPKSFTWTELIRWMGDGVQEIYYVSEMEKFVG